MKETIGKAVSLALGVIAAGKEQIEKTVQELVKKGEIAQAESRALADELVTKGEEIRQRIESLVRERVNAVLKETGLATREDIERIERRLDALERQSSRE